MSILSAPHFHNETAAIARLEDIVWPQGPFCPRCGGFDRITPVKGGRAGLRREHNLLGRYSYSLAEPLARGAPLAGAALLRL